MGEEQVAEPSRSNFGAVELLGSGGRIKPECVSQEQKGKIPNTSSAPLSFCFG